MPRHELSITKKRPLLILRVMSRLNPNPKFDFPKRPLFVLLSIFGLFSRHLASVLASKALLSEFLLSIA